MADKIEYSVCRLVHIVLWAMCTQCPFWNRNRIHRIPCRVAWKAVHHGSEIFCLSSLRSHCRWRRFNQIEISVFLQTPSYSYSVCYLLSKDDSECINTNGIEEHHIYDNNEPQLLITYIGLNTYTSDLRLTPSMLYSDVTLIDAWNKNSQASGAFERTRSR